jgi:hypothetical protein
MTRIARATLVFVLLLATVAAKGKLVSGSGARSNLVCLPRFRDRLAHFLVRGRPQSLAVAGVGGRGGAGRASFNA